MSLTKVSYSMITGAPVNVLDYGASTSASGAVNLASIQAAIDSLPNTGGSVYIPAGNYTVNGTITFPTNNIILFGDGGVGYEAITSKGTTLSFVNATIGFDLSSASPAGSYGSEINNLLIYGSNVLSTGVKNSRKLSMTNVCISNCISEGLWLWDWTISSNFYSCAFSYNANGGTGVKISGTLNTSTITTCTFYSCVIRRNENGLYISDGNSIIFRDTIFESNYGTAITINSYNLAYPAVSQVLFDGCYTENNGMGPLGTNYLYAPVINIDCQSATPATAVGPEQIVFSNTAMGDSAGKRFTVNVGRYITVENCKVYAPYQNTSGPKITYTQMNLTAYAEYVSFINTLTPYTVPTPDTDPGVDGEVYVLLDDQGVNTSVVNGGSSITETWTPELRINNSATGITYTTREGLYTKNGNMITVSGFIQLSSKGASTGDVTIAGLPYESATTTIQSMSFSYINKITLTGILGGRASASTLVLENLLYTGSTIVNVTQAALANDSGFGFSITYQARVISSNFSRLI